jgi:hypothetical protein
MLAPSTHLPLVMTRQQRPRLPLPHRSEPDGYRAPADPAGSSRVQSAVPPPAFPALLVEVYRPLSQLTCISRCGGCWAIKGLRRPAHISCLSYKACQCMCTRQAAQRTCRDHQKSSRRRHGRQEMLACSPMLAGAPLPAARPRRPARLRHRQAGWWHCVPAR